MTRAIRRYLCLSLPMILGLTGCDSYDGQAVRKEHVAAYSQAIEAKTAEALAGRKTLSLEDCIRIALENNLEMQSAAIGKRIAKLERGIAFSNFLPVVSVDYSQYEFDPSLSLPLSEDEPVSIERARSLLWSASVPIFAPATWFLYDTHKRGEEIADWLLQYTRQMTTLGVTVLYFECLTLEQVEQAIQAEIRAAEALVTQLAGLEREGLLRRWQVDEAEVYAKAQRVELKRTKRSARQAKAALLAAMGLSPLAEVALAGQTPIEPPQGVLEDLILEAMLSHPTMQIEDRRVAIEKEKVKLAMTNFLPVLGGFVYRPDLLEGALPAGETWIYGLAGTLALFDGFANVNEYKAAKERRKQAYNERERAAMALMLEVLRAQQNLETAADQLDLARRAMEVASQRYADMWEKWQEGLMDSAGLLEEAAEKSRAQMHLMAASFQHEVSAATLLNVMGKTQPGIGEEAHGH